MAFIRQRRRWTVLLARNSSLLKGLRMSKLYGRKGIITSIDGGIVLARGKGIPRVIFPGFRDIRGYQAMYQDFRRAIRTAPLPR